MNSNGRDEVVVSLTHYEIKDMSSYDSSRVRSSSDLSVSSK